MTLTDTLLLAVALLTSFFSSFVITRKSVGLGSDHPAHVFMINNIKANNNRLFVTFPKIVNTTYCGAMPMFLHWILAQLKEDQLTTVARYLNPVINTLITLCAFLFCLGVPVEFMPQSLFASLVSFGVALTPQFYHAFSARNFGISSRPLGLLLISLLLMAHYSVFNNPTSPWPFAFAVLFGYWAIAFNTFALQTMLTFSVLSLAAFSNWHIPVATLISLGLFLALHPNYGWSYIKHTFLFSKAYSAELAAIFILVRRPSIWRDFVWDFWRQLATTPLKKSFSYIYENSLIIVIFLNPLFLIGVFGSLGFGDTPRSPLVAYSGMIIVIALIVFLATSFRITRFYGEPERYIEMASVFGTISGIYFAYTWFGIALVTGVLAYCFTAVLVQIIISNMLTNHLEDSTSHYDQLIDAINANMEKGSVRFAANNEEITKHVMAEDWNFVRYWSFGNPLAGFSVSQTFYKYPFIRMPVFEEIIDHYDVNVCVIDLDLEGDFLSNAPEKKDRTYELYRQDNLVVYKIG